MSYIAIFAFKSVCTVELHTYASSCIASCLITLRHVIKEIFKSPNYTCTILNFTEIQISQKEKVSNGLAKMKFDV